MLRAGKYSVVLTTQDEMEREVATRQRRQEDHAPLAEVVPFQQPTLDPGSLVAERERDGNIGLLQRLLITDALALQAAWWISSLLFTTSAPRGRLLLAGLVGTAAGLVMLSITSLYKSRVSTVRETEIRRLAIVAAVSAVASYFSLTTGSAGAPQAGRLGLTVVLTFLALTVGRSFFDEWLRAKRTTGRYQRPIVLVGSGSEVAHLVELLADHPDFGLRVKQVVPSAVGDDPTLLDRVNAALDSTGSQGVLLTAQGISIDDKHCLISDLARRGVHVHLSSGLWGIDYRRIRAVPVAHEPLFYVEPAATRRVSLGLKRAIDVVGSLVALLLCSPLLLVAFIAILVEDGRPVLFRQKRVGQGGTVFDMLKLRSMVCDAEKQVVDLRDLNHRDGPLFKNDGGDPRITRVGRVIRALSIDELPQLLNVLRGEMSLVGPRPALPQEVEEFDAELQSRSRAKPGITGLWQVEARDKPSFSAYRRLDLFYIDNWSLMLDLLILVMTVQSVIGRGFRMLRHRQ